MLHLSGTCLLAHLVEFSVHLAHGAGSTAGHCNAVVADGTLNAEHESNLSPQRDEATGHAEGHAHELADSAG